MYSGNDEADIYEENKSFSSRKIGKLCLLSTKTYHSGIQSI